tara:strand:- start:2905 stop:3525 length:621 start_codon:yes stop_codon:yes gene_type:complete
MKRRSQKGGEGMFENLFDKVKGYFTTNTNEQPENNNINQEPQSNSVTQDNRDSLESEQPTEPIQNEEQNNIVEKSENENQQGGKTKKKKKSLKLKKKKTARKKKSKKNKTKDRKHGSGSTIGKLQPEPEEEEWRPKSGDHGIIKYYGQHVIVEGLNGRKEVGKLIRMNGMGKGVPRSIILEGDNGSISQWVNIKKVTHPDERIGEI